MQQTYAFKGKPSPDNMTLRIKFFKPVVLRPSVNRRPKAEVEQSKVVDQLEKRVLADLAEGKVTVRDMVSGEQELVEIDNLIKYLKEE